MKRYIHILGVVLATLFFSGRVYAENLNIVFLDSQRILYESQAGKETYNQLKTLKESKEAEIDKMKAKLKSISDEVTAKGPTMSAAARDELQMQYEQELKKYDRYVKDAQEELRRKELLMIKPLSSDMDEIIKNYSKENAIDIIFDKRNPAIIYGSDKIDITTKILEIYDKQYKKKAPKKE